MKKFFVLMVIGLLLLAVPLLAPTDAKALSFTLNYIFNGATPTSTPPWLTATFTDVSPGTVNLALTASLDVGSEYIESVAFNVNPSILPSDLTISQSPVANPIPISILHITDNAQDLLGGGIQGKGFDIMIQWTVVGPDTNPGRFNDSDVVTFTLSYAGLTSVDFDYTNSSGLPIAAHIQGIPPLPGETETRSGAATVPEPATMLLLGSGLIGLAGYGRKKFFKK